MGLVTLRPDSTVSSQYFTVAGAANYATAVSDDLDTSYIQSVSNSTIRFTFSTAAVPVGAYIQSVVPRVRWLGTKPLRTQIFSSLPDMGFNPSPYNSSPMTILNFPPSVITTQMAGGYAYRVLDNMQSEVDNLELMLQFLAGTGTQRIYEVYLDVFFNLKPTVSAVIVAGTTLSTRPTVSWTFTDPENDTQDCAIVKIFTAAQYGATGFDPETDSLGVSAWESTGDDFYTDTFMVIGADLVNGTTYKAYVKASDLFSAHYSDWVVGSAFTISVDLPAVPIITAVTLVPATASVSVAIQGLLNLLSLDDASLETSIGSWATSGNSVVARDMATVAVNGTATLKVTSSAAGNFSARTATGLSGEPVKANAFYVATVKARPAVTARNLIVGISWYTTAGALISSSLSATTVTTAGVYTQVSTGQVQAPATAAFATMTLSVQGATAAAEVFNFDQMGIGFNSTWTRGGLSETSAYNLQRSYDAGVTWESLTLGTNKSLPILSAQVVTFLDYLSRPNTPVIYRVSQTGIDAITALTLTSPWSASSASVTPLATVFWLKNPLVAAQNMKINIAGDLEHASLETQGLFQAIGRTRAVVVSGDLYGEQFALPLAIYSEADWLAFEVLRKAQATLLLQSDMTQQWWIRFGPDRQVKLVNRTGRKLTPYRQIQIDAVEVDSV